MALALSLCFAAFSFAGSIKNDIVDSYVRVKTEGRFGSGSVIEINKEQYILTCQHVVEPALKTVSINMTLRNGKQIELFKQYVNPIYVGRKNTFYECKVVAHCDGEGVDLALLKPLNPIPFKSAKLFDKTQKTLEVGEPVWYIGTPEGTEANLESTILSDLNYKHKAFAGEYYLINGNGTYGSSGGGMFVKRGGEYLLAGTVCLLSVKENPKSALCATQIEIIHKFREAYKANGHNKKD